MLIKETECMYVHYNEKIVIEFIINYFYSFYAYLCYKKY